MIRYILKLWSSNYGWFHHALEASVDGMELYHDSRTPEDWDKLAILKQLSVVSIHAPHEHEDWTRTKALADFFKSRYIILHPPQAWDDPRVLMENMPGLDIHGEEMPRTLSKPMCCDIEKAVKAACYFKRPYQEYIEKMIQEYQPEYFHISGGDKDSPIEQHTNLWEANFDTAWIRKTLEDYAKEKEIMLVFETPKDGHGTRNDFKNMQYFKNA